MKPLSPTQSFPQAKRGPVIGRAVRTAEPSANVQESLSTDTIATGMALGLESTKEPTTCAPSIPPTSFVGTDSLAQATTLLVRDYSPGQRVQLTPELEAKLVGALSWRGDTDTIVKMVVLRLLAAPGNWMGQTLETLLNFYLDNLYIKSA